MSVSIHNPYLQRPESVWLRGNLHTHTTRSDGALPRQQAIDAYAALGYDFLALSDHDLPPDMAGLDARGMVLLPAREISSSVGHLLVVGPGSFETLSPTLHEQEVIDAMLKAGSLAILCHPSWGRSFSHYTTEQLRSFAGYTGIEIFNGSILDEPGNPFAADKWDQVLMDGRVVWGFASDDMHAARGVGRGWCMVRAAARTPEAVLDALRSGSFYASTGLAIEQIEVRGAQLRVAAPEAEALAVVGEAGKRLAWAESSSITYDGSDGREPFFRVEAYGRANRRAWTQPFTLGGAEIDRRRALLQERPALTVPVVSRGPELAGDLSDPLWQQAAVTDRFLRGLDGGKPEVRTELRAIATPDTLFLGVVCEEPLVDRMKLTVRQDGCSNIWTDDSIEMFLDVAGTAESYFHLMTSPLGVVWSREQGRLGGRARVPGFRARALRGKTLYTVEVAIPLSELGVARPSGRWGFNLVRNRYAVPGRFTWSFVGESNHTPSRFGTLAFKT